MSGSGKSTALKAFEDIGYYCVDNLPIALMPEFLSLTENASTMPTRVALVMDVREKSFLDRYRSIFTEIKEKGFHVEILFLDANDEVLVRRFSQTRRQHPLRPRGNVLEGIRIEREHLMGLREWADKLIDTSDFNVHQLRQDIIRLYSSRKRLDQLVIHLLSFGFKYGVPADANLVLDVRFLPNPYFEPELCPLSGCDREVRTYVLEKKDTMEFLHHVKGLLKFLVPEYRKEGKSYLVIAVGCTGGRHRSVVIVEHLKEVFTGADEEVIVTHRDLELEE
ncbi:MAG: RNase adapter RapZ [Deltaproteobacteria bacterium]|nr:RNase adapter RapZ [Deltaproteobacteria bacterium]MBW2097388.1 RNase adapter RapZ [Deltaproteobacteria bacterium]RKX57925.1 MAG: RNase adapter RapZ [Thermodesulfobacteriota bacterium]